MVFARERTPFSSVRQLGLLTSDLSRLIDNIRRLYGLEPDRLAFYPNGSNQENCARKLAFYNFPEIELEVIEPVNSAPIWSEFIERHGDCLHHVQFNVDDIEEAAKRMKSMGIKQIDGGRSITDPEVEFLFFDTMDSLGYVTEIVNFRQRERT